MHAYIDGTLIHLCRRRRHFHLTSKKIVNITLVRYFIDSTHTTYMVGQGAGVDKEGSKRTRGEQMQGDTGNHIQSRN